MSEIFAGTVEVQDGSGQTTLQLDGNAGDFTAGGNGHSGTVSLQNAGGSETVQLNGAEGIVRAGGNGQDGTLVVRNAANIDAIAITGDSAGAAGVYLGDGAGNAVIELLDVGRINVRQLIDSENRYVLQLEAGSTASIAAGAEGRNGIVTVRDDTGADVIALEGRNAVVTVGAEGKEGDIVVRDGAGRNAFRVDGNNAAVFVGIEGNEGDIRVRDGEGRVVVHVDGNKAAVHVGAEGNEGDVRVYNADGDLSIHLDGASGEVRTPGADCAEHFQVRDAATIEPGTVLVIDDTGALRQSSVAYDRRVAGVVSGAGGLRPGIVLDTQAERPDRMPVALVGKVFCKVDARLGAIAIGDLLTTSDTPGHAMRVADPARAFGAVIGKALAPLAEGRGLVPILVALQ